MSPPEGALRSSAKAGAERLYLHDAAAPRRGVASVEISPTPEECRALRRSLGWSTTVLAAKAGLKARTVIEFELEVRSPQHRTVIAIRRAFRSAGVAVRSPA